MPQLDVLVSALSNRSLTYRGNLLHVDPEAKVLLLADPEAGAKSHFTGLAVPDTFDVFRFFNLSPLAFEPDSGWTFFLRNGSIHHQKVAAVFEGVRDLNYHIEVPLPLSVALVSFYLPVILMGSIFNLITICVTLASPKLRQDPRNTFIVVLAFSDFFLFFFTSPLTLWYTLEGHWPLGGNTYLLCRFLKAAQQFPIFLSSFLINAIACDRFRFIVQSHKRQMSAKQGFLISAVLIGISTCFVLPIFLHTKMWHFPVFTKRTYFCDLNLDAESRIHYTLVSSSFYFFLTLGVVVVLYLLIYLRLKQRPESQNEASNERRRRTHVLMASISGTFFVCWTPVVIFGFVLEFHRHVLPERDSYVSAAYAVTLLCGLCSGLANPVLYSLLNENFRASVRRLTGRSIVAFRATNATSLTRNTHGKGLATDVDLQREATELVEGAVRKTHSRRATPQSPMPVHDLASVRTSTTYCIETHL